MKIVTLFDTDVLGKLVEVLETSGLERTDVKSPYEAFRYKSGGKTAVIAYKTGKVIYSENVKSIFIEFFRKNFRPESVRIGCDEAGKGEALGPLVVSAVALTPDQYIELWAEGVMDSKMLSKKQIQTLETKIRRNSLGCELLVVEPKEFNMKMDEIKSEGKNLNHLLSELHAKAVKSLIEKIQRADVTVLIDKFDEEKTRKAMENMGIKSIVQLENGEKDIAVAAASIIAKAAYDRWVMENQSKVGIKPLNMIYKISYLKPS